MGSISCGVCCCGVAGSGLRVPQEFLQGPLCGPLGVAFRGFLFWPVNPDMSPTARPMVPSRKLFFFVFSWALSLLVFVNSEILF